MLQQQALQVKAPYGRRSRPVTVRGADVSASPLPAEKEQQGKVPWQSPYQGPSYYGLPAVKWSHYGKLVAGYIFLGGLSGAAQVLATLADWTNPQQNQVVVRSGRYLALAGAALSPIFLITDL